jgi:CheY-like chemotaxis protein
MIRRPNSQGFCLDLATASIMIVGDKANEQDILAQMLSGFGVTTVQRRASAAEALRALLNETFDLALIDGEMKGNDGYELVHDIRRQSKESVRCLPIIVIRGHVKKNDVFRARDCGANFVVVKPLLPQVLFDRIVWLARDQRRFVECDTYVGPDRRIKAFGPPLGMKGRRSDDLSEHVGEAKEPNLSQDHINDLFGSTKVSI